MVNKKGVWFLTLFSLILVLSVYYITMPPELLIASETIEDTTPIVNTEESSLLIALRVESDESLEKEIESLQKIISDSESKLEDKNKAFEKLKELNSNRSIEEKLEIKIKDKFKLESFIKITDNNISVTVNEKNHNNELANNIMRCIQEEFNNKIKITIKFEEK